MVCGGCELSQEIACKRCGKPLGTADRHPVTPEVLSLRESERRAIQSAITRYPIQVSARLLGISRAYLYEKIKLHGLGAELPGHSHHNGLEQQKGKNQAK